MGRCPLGAWGWGCGTRLSVVPRAGGSCPPVPGGFGRGSASIRHCGGRLCPWWLKGVSTAASCRQRATVAQLDQSSGAVSRESRLCLLWPEIWGCLHTVVTLGLKGSLKSREVVFLCSLSEEKFYNKQSSCILSACCIHFQASLVPCVLRDTRHSLSLLLSHCFLPHMCRRGPAV